MNPGPTRQPPGGGDPGKSDIPQRLPRRSWGRILAVFLLLVLGAMGAAAVWVYQELHQPYVGYGGESRLVLIENGLSVTEIARLLEAEGVIRHAPFLTWYVRVHYSPPSLKAGEYLFDRPLSVPEVAEKLHKGRVHYYKVTVPEGLTMEEIAQVVGTTELFSTQRLQDLMADASLIAELDPEATNLEGYLFPETYHVTRTVTENLLVAQMVQNFRERWTAERAARAQELAMTVREVVTLASLIEKETGLDEERPHVSAVFHNRLRQNIRLACDPTVIYAVKLVKEFDGIIHQSDLQLDSPYNTYLYPGLPPGPIANPVLESIEAALYPSDAKYLYFVSRNDGSHVFSDNYRDHERAVREYQR